MTIQAKYENGVFRPLGEISIEEGTVVEVHLPAQLPTVHRAIEDFPFVGMWKDRDDLGDSVEYINRLRRELRR